VHDFEVSGIHLNAASKVHISGCKVHRSRTDTPVNGRYSGAMNLIRAVHSLGKKKCMHVCGRSGGCIFEPTLCTTSWLGVGCAKPWCSRDIKSAKECKSTSSSTSNEWCDKNKLAAIANTRYGVKKYLDAPYSKLLEEAVLATNKLLAGQAITGLFASLTKGIPDGSLVAGILIHPKLNVGPFHMNKDTETGACKTWFDNLGRFKGRTPAATKDCSASVAINIVKTTVSDLKVDPAELNVLNTRQTKRTKSYNGGHVRDNFGFVVDVDTVKGRSTRGGHTYNSKAKAAKLVDLQVAMANFKAHCICLSRWCFRPTCPATTDRMKPLLAQGHIPFHFIQWTQGRLSYHDMLGRGGLEEVPGGDYMFHTNKGAIGIKIDGALQTRMTDVSVDGIGNVGQRRCMGCKDAGYLGGLAAPITISAVYDCSMVRWTTAGTTSNYDGTDKNSKFLNENREVKPLWADYPLEIQQCSATGFNPKLPIN